MSDLEGRRYHDPNTDEEFTVVDAPTSAGVPVSELDQQPVTIEFDDGETQTVPHDRFRGVTTYEEVSA